MTHNTISLAKGLACVLALLAATACESDQASPSSTQTESPSNSASTASVAPTTQVEDAATEPPSDDPLPENMNTREEHLTSLLSSVGLTDVGIAEHGFENADVSATFKDVQVFVREYGVEFPTTPGDVVGDLDLGAARGEVVATETVGQLLRFLCGQSIFEVVVPPSTANTSLDEAGDAMETDVSKLMLTRLNC